MSLLGTWKGLPVDYTLYPTKKALREAVARGERVETLYGCASMNGVFTIAGPTRPNACPHATRRWYASVIIKDGVIVRLIDRESDLIRYYRTGKYSRPTFKR